MSQKPGESWGGEGGVMDEKECRHKLKKAKRLLEETNNILLKWFLCCDSLELRQSFSDWVKLNSRINKFLKED